MRSSSSTPVLASLADVGVDVGGRAWLVAAALVATEAAVWVFSMLRAAWSVAFATAVVSGVGVGVMVGVGEIAMGVGVVVGLLQLPKSTRPRTAVKAK
jgi:hypothetical protein